MKKKLLFVLYRIYAPLLLLLSVLIWSLIIDFISKQLGCYIYSDDDNNIQIISKFGSFHSILMIILFFTITYGGIYCVDKMAKFIDKLFTDNKLPQKHK